VASAHNAINHGYETFGNASADTMRRTLDPEEERFTGKPVTERDWYRTVPPPRTLMWSLRDNVNYMETGVLSALQYVAQNGPRLLRGFWQRGASAVREGQTAKPYAVAIPEAQRDRRRLAAMIDLLRAHGIEVARTAAPLTVEGRELPAGTFLVRLDQPYRGWALDLLAPQKYPAEDAPYEAYDDVGWSLPQCWGVEAVMVDDPAVRALPIRPVTEAVAFGGTVAGEGSTYLLRDTGQEALLAARARLARFPVEVAEKPFAAGGVDYPAGSWVIGDRPGLRRELTAVAAELALDFTAVAETPSVPRHPLDLPRLAVLQTWSDTQSGGWVRMIFDEEKVPYTLIMDDDVKAGRLRQRFDVILFPNTWDGLKGIVGGIDPRFSPLPYTRTPQYPDHGTPTSSPDITGGLTWRGVGNLEDFVRAGGVLVTLGGASALPLDGGIARDVRHARVKEVATPGSVLRARFRRPDHPLAYGYPETIGALRENRTVYDVRLADRSRVVLQWGSTLPKDPTTAGEDEAEDEDASKKEKEPLVISGGIKGAKELEGKPALLDLPVGQGRVVAFDFDPIHRTLARGDFRLVWNAVLNWNDLPR
jgi:hypothetical protein